MFPVLVRSSTNKDENLTSTTTNLPRELSNPSRLLKNLKHGNANGFNPHNVIDEMNEFKYVSLFNMPPSFDDTLISTHSDEFEKNRPSSLKRSNSDQELPNYRSPPSNLHLFKNSKNDIKIDDKMATFKQPGRKTFSTLFMANNATKDDSSIILSGSRLDPNDQSIVKKLDPADFVDFNRRFSIQRPSVITIGEHYNSFYNSVTSLNSYYVDPHYYDQSSDNHITLNGMNLANECSESDINQEHIKYVTIFAVLYFWCFPLTGVPSIIFSRLSKKYYNRKQYDKAKSYLSKSELFLILTFFFGFTLIAAFFLYLDYAYFKKSKFFS